RAPGQRGLGAAARRARLLQAQAHHRRASLAAEQQARARARGARAHAQLQRELDRARDPGRGLRLARALIGQPAPISGYFFSSFFMSPEGGVDGDDGVAEGDELEPEEGVPAGGVDELEEGADEGELLELGAFFDASSPHAARASAAAA